MGCIDFDSIITSLVLTTAKALCGLFCAPFYDEIETTVKAILDPKSLDEDSNKLKLLLHDISALKDSEVINKWIDEAKQIIHHIDQLRLQESRSSNHNDDHQSSCFLCGDACSRCNLHRNIKKMITRGEIIKRPTLERETVEHISDVPYIKDGTTAGRNLERVMDMLNDEGIWRIGVWGPGGVGKSTLVKALNNKLESDCRFSLVRFIELKGSDEQRDVQEAIAKILKLDMGEGIENQIRNTLKKEKFLLILDNVWSESIKLSGIGIPEKKDGSKIVLTTRSLKVCIKMEAKPIEMGYLTKEEAWQLFKEKAGEDVNNGNIEKLARDVCNECGGLPLAIAAVGSAMKGEADSAVWNDAVDNLRKSVPIDLDIESKVFNSLKLSYEALDGNLKDCFLYCSLYPEGHSIETEELVNCWIAENLIEQELYYTNAYYKGLGLIKKLKESCLLEEEDPLSEMKLVKMHDVVRDVAKWIGRSMKKSAIMSGYGISMRPTVELREEVKNSQWVSFVDNKEIKLPADKQDCSSVTTLLLYNDFTESWSQENLKVSTEFLEVFPAVKVLNIVGVQSFAASPLELEELRALLLRNCDIKELPAANNLMTLRISESNIDNLPRGMGELSNLKVLNVSKNFGLKRIDAEIIRNLKFLEALDTHGTSYKWPVRKRNESEEATLQDLSRLQYLRQVYLEIAETDGTYDECSWIGKLESFYFYYKLNFESNNEGKTFSFYGRTKVGSFIFLADKVLVYRNKNVSELFAIFPSTEQSNLKMKHLRIARSDIGRCSAVTIPENSFLWYVEELVLSENKPVGRFSEITNAVGANFSELKTLTITATVEVIFCSTDDIALPKLESLSVSYLQRNVVAFDCHLAKVQAIAPNLKILKVAYSRDLKCLCYFESNQQWQSLEIVEVTSCPKLKKFPLMPSIKEIRGSIEWWNIVEWDSEEARSHMNQCFIDLNH